MEGEEGGAKSHPGHWEVYKIKWLALVKQGAQIYCYQRKTKRNVNESYYTHIASSFSIGFPFFYLGIYGVSCRVNKGLGEGGFEFKVYFSQGQYALVPVKGEGEE